jgi:hypothetical protein
MSDQDRKAVAPRADDAATAPMAYPTTLSGNPPNGHSPIAPPDPRPEGNVHRVPQPGNPSGLPPLGRRG